MSSSRNKKRMFHVLLLIVFGISSLFYRLYIIQIKDTRSFTENNIDLIEKSVNQRKQEFVLSSGRGDIYDRNMDSMLEKSDIDTVIVFPFSKNIVYNEKIEILANILNMNFDDLVSQIENIKAPTYIKFNGEPIELTYKQKSEIEQLQIPGIVPIEYTILDYNNITAKHAVGYLGQAPEVIDKDYKDYLEQGILDKDSLIGRSGLQMQFQEILMGLGESRIAYYVDNKGNPLNGLSSTSIIQEDSFYPLSLVTTLDKEIQELVEHELERYNIDDGSVVVLDANNADILAMASAPDFNMNRVNPNSNDWNNKAVQVIEPGSTFKTLIAIAGLEEGVTSLGESFYCSGEVEEYHFSCHEEHGEITFEEAYAESCNITFGEIANRLGAEKIEEYAKRLGLIGTVAWTGEFFRVNDFEQIANEENNRVFHDETNLNDPGSIMRTAIGQQDVRISPLAAANLVVTILNDGLVYEPRLVDKIVYKNGTDYYDFPIHSSDIKVGSKDTYAIVRYLMEKVVDDGTGKLLNQAIWNLAGKTGTAETSNDLTNQWFIGYGPTDNPQYAVSVAIKNVSTNEPLAKEVFIGIMDGLAKMDK